jgi:hypothetical protein
MPLPMCYNVNFYFSLVCTLYTCISLLYLLVPCTLHLYACIFTVLLSLMHVTFVAQFSCMQFDICLAHVAYSALVLLSGPLLLAICLVNASFYASTATPRGECCF